MRPKLSDRLATMMAPMIETHFRAERLISNSSWMRGRATLMLLYVLASTKAPAPRTARSFASAAVMPLARPSGLMD